MIGYISGKVILTALDYCIIETGGIGYRVFLTGKGLSNVTKGQDAKFFIYTNVRDDAILLYGFLDLSEYELFLKLITVSGIGPRVSMGILSAVEPDSFSLAIVTQDIKTLTKLPGVGKKTAERLILELKDKIGDISSGETEIKTGGISMPESLSVRDEALQALLALGYDSGEVMPLLKDLVTENMPVEDIIKNVLKGFSRR